MFKFHYKWPRKCVLQCATTCLSKQFLFSASNVYNTCAPFLIIAMSCFYCVPRYMSILQEYLIMCLSYNQIKSIPLLFKAKIKILTKDLVFNQALFF